VVNFFEKFFYNLALQFKLFKGFVVSLVIIFFFGGGGNFKFYYSN